MIKHLLLGATLFVFASVSQAQTKHLWCTATSGGKYGYGTILEGNDDGTGFHAVFSFADSNGSYPEGKMVQCSDGMLYCTTYLGGFEDSCCICRFNPANDSLSVLYEFMHDQPHGWDSYSGMIAGADGNLYGMTAYGGANWAGVIYRLDPRTGAYTDVYDFDSLSGYSPNTELLQGSDGYLYGLTTAGGANNTGTLFRFDPVHRIFVLIHSFDMHYNNNGVYADLIQANNGLIYGVTEGDGIYHSGTIFSLDPSTDNFTVVHNMGYDSTNTLNPQSGLVQAANGKLYGTTSNGGQGYGVIYSYDLSSAVFSVLTSLSGVTGYGCQRALSVTSAGAILGAASAGGSESSGTIFSFNPSNYDITVLLNMTDSTGNGPSCEIFESNDMPAAIRNIIARHMQFGPNPSSESLSIQNLIPGTPVIVSDLNGQEILHASSTGSNMSINVSGLAPGTYFINGEKFVKE